MIEDRLLHAKSLVYLERMLKIGMKVSMFEIMRQCKFNIPYDTNPKRYLVFEAALKLKAKITYNNGVVIFE